MSPPRDDFEFALADRQDAERPLETRFQLRVAERQALRGRFRLGRGDVTPWGSDVSSSLRLGP